MIGQQAVAAAVGGTGRVLLDVLDGAVTQHPPIWLMRQAGRYLPEYRAVRQQAGSFLDLCYSPDFATEVTLQPIRRFGFDAAILFSDILVVPHAFGQNVWFAEGEGPRLDPVVNRGDLARLRGSIDLDHLAPVFETVRRLRRELPAPVTLLGFCGAPFTVASYMVAGKGTPDQAPIRLLAYQDPDFIAQLIDRLVDGSIAYLSAQFEAGADAVQIFESFASALPPRLLERWSVEPIRRIAEGVRARHPGARIIVFAKGAGRSTARYAAFASALGIDWQTDPAEAASFLPSTMALQGNLDPLALIAGGAAQQEAVAYILESMAGRPHIFNLGHGIQPTTPIAHVERLMEQVRSTRSHV